MENTNKPKDDDSVRIVFVLVVVLFESVRHAHLQLTDELLFRRLPGSLGVVPSTQVVHRGNEPSEDLCEPLS